MVRIGDWSAAEDELPPGERALARLTRTDSGEFEAEIIRRIGSEASRVVGLFRRTSDGGVVVAADRRDKSEYRVLGHDAAGLPDQELVVADIPLHRGGAVCGECVHERHCVSDDCICQCDSPVRGRRKSAAARLHIPAAELGPAVLPLSYEPPTVLVVVGLGASGAGAGGAGLATWSAGVVWA